MLTPAQQLLLKNAIDADPVLAAFPNTANDTTVIEATMNALAEPAYFIWHNSMPTQAVFDTIIWENLIPSDPPDDTTTWTNCALFCQAKQFNLQTLLTGRESISPAKAKIRAGLQSALTAIPSGAAGADRAAGWVELQLTMQRRATVAEKLFSGGDDGTTETPATPEFEGQFIFLDWRDVSDARSS